MVMEDFLSPRIELQISCYCNPSELLYISSSDNIPLYNYLAYLNSDTSQVCFLAHILHGVCINIDERVQAIHLPTRNLHVGLPLLALLSKYRQKIQTKELSQQSDSQTSMHNSFPGSPLQTLQSPSQHSPSPLPHSPRLRYHFQNICHVSQHTSLFRFVEYPRISSAQIPHSSTPKDKNSRRSRCCCYPYSMLFPLELIIPEKTASRKVFFMGVDDGVLRGPLRVD
ncbi:hypothetical protein B0J14DRAFT_46803 [Halenospora varia]|nr:hypothetical protein B0J14DRAFT_46803 [Halenospora varia]